MEIILLENILKLGNIGDKVTVKNGYGRNFLLKQGKALRFTKQNLELVNKKKEELNKKNNEIKSKFIETAKLINNKTFIFYKESKENDELYGSIKPKEISVFKILLISLLKNIVPLVTLLFTKKLVIKKSVTLT